MKNKYNIGDKVWTTITDKKVVSGRTVPVVVKREIEGIAVDKNDKSKLMYLLKDEGYFPSLALFLDKKSASVNLANKLQKEVEFYSKEIELLKNDK